MSTVEAGIRGVGPQGAWRERTPKLVTVLMEALGVVCISLGEMPFLDHLEELRRRIIRSLIAVAVGVFVSWTWIVPLIEFLKVPAEKAGIKIVAIEATEIFSLYFKVAFLGGICLAAPFILWQVWQFIVPALHKHERRYARPFILSTSVCFLAGTAFGYAFLVPLALRISAIMAHDVHIEITMQSSGYFDTMTMLVLSGGIIFQIPPIIFILSRIGLVSARFLARHFKYAILISVILAAVLTPSADATTMTLVAAPMILLYGLGIIVAWIFGRNREAA